MDLIEFIDNNNFVIKIRSIDIKNEYFDEELYHGRYSWNLKSINADDNRVYFLKWTGPNNNTLLNIDASVTFDFFKQDGTKGITRSIDTSFNMAKPECELKVSTGDDFNAIYTNVEVCVKFNSVTGLQRDSCYLNFEQDGQLSDVALIVEGKKLYANKAVLATLSPVFRAMFFSGFRESTAKEVEIKDAEYDNFLDFLQVMHTAYSHIYEENAGSILVLADRFNVPIVLGKCDNYFASTESDFTSLETLAFAKRYRLPEFHRKCKDAIIRKEELRHEQSQRHKPRRNKEPFEVPSYLVNSVIVTRPESFAKFDKEDDQLSDVAFVVEGKKLYANKAVLATFSPVFRELFFPEPNQSTDNEAIINDIKYEDFKQFLQLIHTAFPTITGRNMESLLILADRYKVDVVMEKCENHLLSAICGNVEETLRLAKIYSFPKVHEKYKNSLVG